MKNKNIEFFKIYEGVSDYYAPKPAIKMLPDWYKEMPSYMGINQDKIANSATNATIKKCLPVLDSMAAGYFIVTHCDINIKWDGIHYEFDVPVDNIGYISDHDIEQIKLHPDNGDDLMVAPKYKNPWGIKTPTGYSCIIIPPMHRDNEILIMPGIVDTDKYHNAIQLPFTIKNKKQDAFIPAGTPIAQVIPFKREGWVSAVTKNFNLSFATKSLRSSMFLDGYKKAFWSRKSYL